MRHLKSQIGHILRKCLRFEEALQHHTSVAKARCERHTRLFDYLCFGVREYHAYQFESFKTSVMGYLRSCHRGDFQYAYHAYCQQPVLYASMYALMIRCLLGTRPVGTEAEQWGVFLDSFQSEDGLFRDAAIVNDQFEDLDWWGAKHLTLHAITCYSLLKRVPPRPFRMLNPLYSDCGFQRWIDGLDWTMSGDSDNAIMNVSSMLQMARDGHHSIEADLALKRLSSELLLRRNETAGCWWRSSLEDRNNINRACQVAYHLWTGLLYDGHKLLGANDLVDLALRNQNESGGFAPHIETSACEDIDSIYLLMQANEMSPYRADEVRLAANRYLVWALSNKNTDGGFVFLRNHTFEYGHELMTSPPNVSSLFATWFRSLSIAYALKILRKDDGFNLHRVAGFQLA